MKNYRIIFIGGLIAVGLLAALASKEAPQGSLLQSAPEGSHSHTIEGGRPELLAEGTQAPEFRLTRVGGGSLGLDDLKGSHAALVFVTPTCPYCKEFKTGMLDRDLPDLGDRFVFITPEKSAGVELSDEQVELERYVSSTFPVLTDSARSTARLYNANLVPTTYLLDGEGVVVGSAIGPAGGMKLVDQLVERAT